MQQYSLYIPEPTYSSIIKHLLPQDIQDEEVAFVFAKSEKRKNKFNLKFEDWYPLKPDDFVTRSPYFFELTEATKGHVIKKAHDLQTSLIELHSHIDQKEACFSPTDWKGFQTFVPHISWRLPNRPYTALVVTEDSFDGLVWPKNRGSQNPLPLSSLKTDNHTFHPTKRSFKRWVQ